MQDQIDPPVKLGAWHTPFKTFLHRQKQLNQAVQTYRFNCRRPPGLSAAFVKHANHLQDLVPQTTTEMAVDVAHEWNDDRRGFRELLAHDDTRTVVMAINL